MKRERFRVGPVAAVCMLISAVAWTAEVPSSQGAAAALAKTLLRRAGVSRGVCAVLGTKDGCLPLAIARSSGLLVHVLEESRQAVQAARRAVDVDGLWCRRIVVEAGSLRRLPYADNTIDVVLAADLGGRDLSSVSPGEVLRVLRPGGKAILGLAEDGTSKLSVSQLTGWLAPIRHLKPAVRAEPNGLWTEITKPQPEGVDDWSHWQHDVDNNPVSSDSVIKAPYMTQWYGRPYYIAMPATTVASGGRVFLAMGHIAHHKREWVTLNALVARNGYNGAVLWERKLPEGYMVHRSAFIATDRAFHMIDGDRCLILEPETGKELGEIRIPKLREKWEWMAMEGGTLFVLSGEGSAAETTKRERQHGHWSWQDLSKGYYAKRVPWGFGKTLTAYDMKAKRVLWQHSAQTAIDSRGMAIGGGKIYFYCPDAQIACLDARSGSLQWTNDDKNVIRLIEEPGRGLISTPGFRSTCFVLYTPKALFFEAQTRMYLVAISTADGSLLWRRRKVSNNPNPIYVDGQVVVGVGPRGSHLVLNPVTGEVLQDLGFVKRSCVRLTATPDSFFVRGEGLLRYDRSAKKVLVNGAVRAGCNDGAIPANGLLYVGPWLCDCNLSLMGTVAMCSDRGFRFDHVAKESEHLEQASEGRPRVAPLPASGKDWPTYRASNHRGGASKAQVSRKVRRRWHYHPAQAEVPTPPTAAGGLIFLAGQDGKVRAINAGNGQQAWCFLTAGPILMPPTISGGQAYVGSADGYVYALEAATGRPLWRFRAAPAERRIMVYGALGSTWPVNTGVLVQDGAAYLAAGIIDCDGTYVFALDAATGKIKWQNNSSGHLNPGIRKGVSAQGTMTVLGDRLLMAGGNQVCPASYDAKTGKCLVGPPGNGLPKANRGQEVGVFRGKYLIFGGRLLYSAVEKVVSPAFFEIRGPGVRARLLAGRVPPAWNDKTFAFVHAPRGGLVCCDGEKVEAILAGRDSPQPTERARQQAWRSWAALRIKASAQRWVSTAVTADKTLSLALAENAVLAVCESAPRDKATPEWHLIALAVEDGRTLWQEKLPGRPLPGGLIVDRTGQVIIACQDGGLLCYGEPEDE